jgi:nitrogen fixation protein FixH
MKLNWGLGIALGFLCFVLFMSTLVIQSFRQNFDLVHEDYYGEELKYQDRINRGMQSSGLTGKITYELSATEIVINFPGEIKKQNISGEVLFFRPSDKKMDVKARIHLNDGQQHFQRSLFSKGLYKIQINWEAAGTKYYNEEIIKL